MNFDQFFLKLKWFIYIYIVSLTNWSYTIPYILTIDVISYQTKL